MGRGQSSHSHAKVRLPFREALSALAYAGRSSVDAVKQHDTALLADLASKFNLSYTAFGKPVSVDDEAYGTLVLSDAFGTALEPAPITPTGEDAAPYQLLSGTIKATWNAHQSLKKGEDITEVFVAPSIMTGNTGAFNLLES